jgi:hypothetical protein
LPRREILTPIALQRCHGDWRIDVIERADAIGDALHQIDHRDAIRHIRPHDDRIGRGNACAETDVQIFDAVVEFELAEVRLREVARGCVPRHIALQKQQAMTALCQTAQQRAVGGGMTVPPG